MTPAGFETENVDADEAADDGDDDGEDDDAVNSDLRLLPTFAEASEELMAVAAEGS